MGAPPERAQHVVDITPTFDRKIAALRAHVSQTGRWTELEQRIRGFGAATAARFRLPEGHIAEVFQVVTIG
jgi:LmbE family N-acetylglucosaminyl deacetylase